MRRLTLEAPETVPRIGRSRPLAIREWKQRITEHADEIGQEKTPEAVKRMAKKLAKRDAAQGHVADPDVLVRQLFIQREEPPVVRANHLDPTDPRVRTINYADPTGEEASAKVDRERAA